MRSGYLNSALLRHLPDNAQKQLSMEISSSLRCGSSTVEKHLIRLKNAHSHITLPLIIVDRLCTLLKISRKRAINEMSTLYCNADRTRKQVRALKRCTIEFSKIVGAFMADGYMQRTGNSYKIKITDGEKTSIYAFAGWIGKAFDIQCRVYYEKSHNMWYCWFNNKIIGRYFEHILGISPGHKTFIACRPRNISSISNKQAFTLGVLTFDGGVKTCGIVGFSSVSKALISDVTEVLRRSGARFTCSYNAKRRFYALASTTGREEDQLRKWLQFLEPGTRKYDALQFIISGGKRSIRELAELFPRHHHAAVSLSDIYTIFGKKKRMNVKALEENLRREGIKVSQTTLYKYLHLLFRAKLLNRTLAGKVAIYSRETSKLFIKCQSDAKLGEDNGHTIY